MSHGCLRNDLQPRPGLAALTTSRGRGREGAIAKWSAKCFTPDVQSHYASRSESRLREDARHFSKPSQAPPPVLQAVRWEPNARLGVLKRGGGCEMPRTQHHQGLKG
eukprot:scaffold154417_cov49-Prasinocladus_malaysianus.AAC.1